MKKNLTIKEAREQIFSALPEMASEKVAVTAALSRHVAADVVSLRTLPGKDNSAMDGYALRAQDIKNATTDAPTSLAVVGVQTAGGPKAPSVKPGQAVRIMTGAAVPEGADCVVMRELCDESSVLQGDAPKASGQVLVKKALPLKEAIRFRGEDILEGRTILQRGDAIGPAQLNLLLSAGHTEVSVIKKPSVAIMASGDELVEIGEAFDDESVINSNAYAIAAACKKMGLEPELLGIAKDTLDDHRERIGKSDADIVLTIGGVSMGTHDFVKPAFEALDYKLAFWKVAMRPGKPLAFGTKGKRLAFGLPGNPVSSLVSFMLFVAPAIRTMMGEKSVLPRTYKARVKGASFKKRKGVVFHARALASFDEAGELVCEIVPKQSSGQIAGMAHANALCVIDSEREVVNEGDTVSVMWL